MSEETNTEVSTYRYEFSYRLPNDSPSFVILWDTNDKSAVERATCDQNLVIRLSDTGNGFCTTLDGMQWCFTKTLDDRPEPAHVVGDYKPLASEKGSVRKTNPTTTDILKGLLPQCPTS